jgi:hypothetical protein
VNDQGRKGRHRKIGGWLREAARIAPNFHQFTPVHHSSRFKIYFFFLHVLLAFVGSDKECTVNSAF